MKSILLIIPYFGQWPLWFEAYLVSIKANPTVNWLCPTDCELPEDYPENLKFLKTTLPELNQQVNQVVKANVPLTPRKFCDLKPAYGEIFQEEIKNYNFWGFCDMDIIWGDIRKFMTPEIIDKYDIISSRKENISGHFNLFKNTAELKQLYKQIPNYQSLFEKERFMWFDEHILSNYLKTTQHDFTIKWNEILCNQEKGGDSHQEYELNRWFWNKGKLINTKTNEEVMYLHFINWKRTMKFSEVNYTDKLKSFYVSYSGMHYKPFSKLRLKLNAFKNVFFGYWQKEKGRILSLRLKSYKKRIKMKLRSLKQS
ncbi:hypothetical protein LB452_10960 [Psychroflexus sp. CAK8W]|uniref:Uncharacterized protein n=1 Tax=Psychroflexus longus TaxID=2873596 RepID=A0ABS7XKE7_9FLAO|nr:DUF6625 family protein [Psychroflexus longus]MBZ9779441.1 hypothetical protein [Psychroflexus longus]